MMARKEFMEIVFLIICLYGSIAIIEVILETFFSVSAIG